MEKWPSRIKTRYLILPCIHTELTFFVTSAARQMLDELHQEEQLGLSHVRWIGLKTGNSTGKTIGPLPSNIDDWLVVTGTMEFWMTFQKHLGISSSQVTFTPSCFRRGRAKNHQAADELGESYELSLNFTSPEIWLEILGGESSSSGVLSLGP